MSLALRLATNDTIDAFLARASHHFFSGSAQEAHANLDPFEETDTRFILGYDGAEAVGTVTIRWDPHYPPFRAAGIPSIQNLEIRYDVRSGLWRMRAGGGRAVPCNAGRVPHSIARGERMTVILVLIGGHYYGWMTEHSLEQIATVDRALGTVLDALPSGATVEMRSDHGDHGRDHGTDLPDDMTIPWLVAGLSSFGI